MKKIVVLFLSADPFSAPPHGSAQRLRLDDDVRQVLQKVRASKHRDALRFEFRLAATSDDLIQALNEVRPQIVHFSGHGGSGGLVLVGPDRKPHHVGTEALAQLFRAIPDDTRLVVLNACFSLPQAKAIAAIVGCAIGTREAISDDAAITFGGALYRAIAFGRSVQQSFDQARAAVAMEHPHDADFPVLVTRPGVDPARLVLVRRRPWLLPAAIWLTSTIGAIALAKNAGEAIVLSLVPLAIAAALMWFLESPAGSQVARAAGTAALALALSAIAVIAGAAVLDDGRPAQESAAIPSSTGDQTAPNTGSPVGQPPAPPPAPTAVDIATDESRVEDRPGEIPDSAPPPRPVPPPPAAPNPPGMEGRLATARELYDEKNYAAAAPIFERAAAGGNAEAKGFLGILYLNGWGKEKQPSRALPLLREAAAEGDARAMNALGVAYEYGEGVSRNYEEAMRWFQQAQERGYAEAMNNIGGLYRLGRSVDADERLALHWYRKAAGAGSPGGMLNAGLCYALGKGTARNVDEAIRLYRMAEAAGSIEAKVQLGIHYMYGDGLQRDYGTAMTLFVEAVDAGSANGMNNLGVLYERGWGVDRDRAQAIYWFRRAAEGGSADGARNLEKMRGR